MGSRRVRHDLGTEKQQLYANKMNNLEETDKFKKVQSTNSRILKRYKSPKIEPGRNRKYEQTITSVEIESVIKNSQRTKAQDQMVSQASSINHLEKS